MIAVLGPGGVGGLLACALERAGEPVVVVAREETAAVLSERGFDVSSVTLGDFHATPRVVSSLNEDVDVLLVATKAGGLDGALERVHGEPGLVVPLLNGLDHVALLRERFGSRAIAAAIRVEADRPQTGVIVHTSKFLRVDMAPRGEAVEALAAQLERAGVQTHVIDHDADVMWGKLVRLNALATTTSASELLLGEIRDDPAWRARLEGAVAEAAAVAQAEGASVEAAAVLGELDAAHATLGSSMARDIAAGRAPELDAIPGAVLRAAYRHDLACPTIEELVTQIEARLS